MGDGTNPLVASVFDHYRRAYVMWEEVVGNIPDEEWRRAEIDQMIPARHLVHVLICDDVFTADIPFDQYDGLRLFGTREWHTPPETLPDRETALRKLAEVREMVAERFARFDDAALLAPETAHPWTGETRLAKLLYELRHSQHHVGEVNAEMKRRGIRAYRRWD